MQKVRITVNDLAGYLGDEGSHFRLSCERHLERISQVYGEEPFEADIDHDTQGKVSYVFVKLKFDGPIAINGHSYLIKEGNVYDITGRFNYSHLNHFTGITFEIRKS